MSNGAFFIMESTKARVLQIVESMPSDASFDDIMAHIYFKMEVEAGLKELEDGKGVPHARVKERMAKWIIK
jgi:hypothetical protein